MTIVSTEPTQVPDGRVPVSDFNPYSDAALIEPWDPPRAIAFCGAANRDPRKLIVSVE